MVCESLLIRCAARVRRGGRGSGAGVVTPAARASLRTLAPMLD